MRMTASEASGLLVRRAVRAAKRLLRSAGFGRPQPYLDFFPTD
jgi:hypothetical protein